MREDTDLGELEKTIVSYYQDVTRHLQAPPDLWLRLAGRLGEQEKPSLADRLLGRAGGSWAAPGDRARTEMRLRWRPAYALATAAIAVGLAAVWLGQTPLPVGQRALPAAPTAETVGLLPAGPAQPQPPELAASGGQAATPSVGPAVVASPPSYGPPTAAATASASPPLASPGPERTATPVAVSGTSALRRGTLAEAQRALGVTITLPRHLPAGTAREDDEVLYYVQDGRGMASVAYRVGERHFAVEFHKPADKALLPAGQPARVGDHEAVVSTTPREPSDPLPPLSTVAWQDGDVVVRVSGDLPPAELLQIAASLY